MSNQDETRSETNPLILVEPSELKSFVKRILLSNGSNEENSEIVSDCLVEADLHGVDSHGSNRIPSYIERIRRGFLDPTSELEWNHVTPVVSHLDARNGFGFVAAFKGIQKAIEIASVYGIGLVSVTNSNHFGRSAYFVKQAASQGYMSLVFTNSSPALPVWGGKEKLMGVSPIACGAPGGGGGDPSSPDFILDMAPSVAARGKIHKALRRGETIPPGWALNSQGRETQDPEEALKGCMLPMGGPKGSGLSIMMDVFSGVLSGSSFAGQVKGPYDPSAQAGVGHFLLVLKPDLFMDMDQFRSRMSHLYSTVVGSERRPGVERIYFPGEIELLESRKRSKEGIPFVQAEIDSLNLEAERAGVPKLVVKG
ncbi:Malate/L-lactate dehydrogenase [Violaceomyces palustris]|uniref:Malate/L-lactate dehydrogenase n=1 Tax=Violaceomyces palustris TaxID=1673888 RepID=A0ACD0NP25_9BASI|nr:Malate/L-lactate dehydrogenase [Violaceomyces palustris]